MRLSSPFRYAVYGAYAALFGTGVLWFVADRFKDGTEGEFWQQLGARVLMLHGGAAMVMLFILGVLFPLHVRRGWRAGKNRLMGAITIALNAALVLTAFALYYLGSETLRPWISAIHFYAGLVLPILLFVHVVQGRRTRRAS